jgi:hypothetical protein
MSEAKPTRPSDKTRAEEKADARVEGHADKLPTPAEEAAAERSDAGDEDAAGAYKEAIERGARQQGEGRID